MFHLVKALLTQRAEDKVTEIRMKGRENVMKLVYAIIRDEDCNNVLEHLNKKGYSITKLSTTGGFMRRGNTTLMFCTDDDKVAPAVEIIKETCGPRQQITCNMSSYPMGGGEMDDFMPMAVNAEVGGAVIFAVSVDYFERI